VAIFRLPTVTPKLLKSAILVVGLLLFAVVGFSVFVIFDAGGDKNDKLLQKAISPDGRLVAELRENITGQWGGPDTMYVAIRRAKDAFGEKVYSKTYECMDHSPFTLEWNGPAALTIGYGDCDTGHPRTTADDRIWTQLTEWQDVKILYRDTKRTATR
jgi:hypothetical protein